MRAFTRERFQSLRRQAAEASRRRAHLNVHEDLDDPVQRLFIGLEPDTYIRPHRHSGTNRWEFLMVVEGAMDALTFDDSGALVARAHMAAGDTRAVEIPPNTWHSYVCLEPGTVAFEVREGPYIPVAESDLAAWAPGDDPEAQQAYLQWMRTAPLR